jgi:hypothetical protein
MDGQGIAGERRGPVREGDGDRGDGATLSFDNFDWQLHPV